MIGMEIKIVSGFKAPIDVVKYATFEPDEAVILEQGTMEGLPVVYFKFWDENDEPRLLVLTGRMVDMVASAVRGINARVHGKERP